MKWHTVTIADVQIPFVKTHVYNMYVVLQYDLMFLSVFHAYFNIDTYNTHI